MASPMVVWMANRLIGGCKKEARQNMLLNLKNNKELLEAVISDDIHQLGTQYVLKTGQTLLIKDRSQCAKDIITYMCEVMFKKELKSVPS